MRTNVLTAETSQSGAEAKLNYRFAAVSYVSMLLGMAAHGMFNHFSNTQIWVWNAFFAAVVISPLVFFAFLSLVKSTIDILTVSLISFLNGFFWKEIFQGVNPILGSSN